MLVGLLISFHNFGYFSFICNGAILILAIAKYFRSRITGIFLKSNGKHLGQFNCWRPCTILVHHWECLNQNWPETFLYQKYSPCIKSRLIIHSHNEKKSVAFTLFERTGVEKFWIKLCRIVRILDSSKYKIKSNMKICQNPHDFDRLQEISRLQLWATPNVVGRFKKLFSVLPEHRHCRVQKWSHHERNRSNIQLIASCQLTNIEVRFTTSVRK